MFLKFRANLRNRSYCLFMLLPSREIVLGLAIGSVFHLRQAVNYHLLMLFFRLDTQTIELSIAPLLLLHPAGSLCLKILHRGCDRAEYFRCLTLLRPDGLDLLRCLQRLAYRIRMFLNFRANL